MSKQIAVRLPDELVEYLDRSVEHGAVSSRAAAVAEALEWQRRREVAARDAAILAGVGSDTGPGGDTEFDELAQYAASTPMDELD